MPKQTREFVFEVLPPVDKNLLMEFRQNKDEVYPSKIVPVDDMRLELGFGLIPLVDKNLRNNFQKRIENIRNTIIKEYGFQIPSIRIVDNCKLKENEYQFFIKGERVGGYTIPKNKYICLKWHSEKGRIKFVDIDLLGKIIKEPAFGVPAVLINKDDVEKCFNAGCTIADAPTIIATNIAELIKQNFDKIFTYDDTKNVLKDAQKKYPELVKDVLEAYSITEVLESLKKMLINNKSIAKIGPILETLLKNKPHYHLTIDDIQGYNSNFGIDIFEMLDIMSKCEYLIRKQIPHFSVISIEDNDTETLIQFSKGNTKGIYQFDSDGMRRQLKQGRPKNILDLTILNALFRPGLLDLLPEMLGRMNGSRKIEYDYPCLIPALQETYGILVFQEQILQIIQDVTGKSFSYADSLRKNMRKRINIESEQKQFIKYAASHGINKKDSSAIFDTLLKYSGIAFRKSHALRNATWGYKMCYIKTHFNKDIDTIKLAGTRAGVSVFS
jgi:hypothetical protein